MELDSIVCPVCDHGGETIDHLLFKCELAETLFFPNTASIKEWLTLVDTQRWSKVRKNRMEVIIFATMWMIWRFRNTTVFEGDKIKKNSLFDSIVLYSFSWLKNRDSNSGVVWNQWLLSPL